MKLEKNATATDRALGELFKMFLAMNTNVNLLEGRLQNMEVFYEEDNQRNLASYAGKDQEAWLKTEIGLKFCYNLNQSKI